MKWTNHYLICALNGWFWAQLIKGLIWAIQHKKFELSRFFGAGGMPSSHSALVISLATVIYLVDGASSALFGVVVIFSFIVLYDASGVRFEVGQQARTINQMMTMMPDDQQDAFDKKLKEYVGHTKLEVFAGSVLGVAIGIFYYLFVMKGRA